MAAEEAEKDNVPKIDLDQLFENTVRGRYKLAEGTSSAKFWAPKEKEMTFTRIVENEDGTTRTEPGYTSEGAYVPRPDRKIDVLRGLSSFPITGILGFDHFYLRSPGTGLAKMLTLGGIGLWYLWDVLQIWFEKNRVLNYGMTTPFDIFTGIGQGMITDKTTMYTQETSFFTWSIATVFGFLGADQFLTGHLWKGVRILLLFVLAATPTFAFLGYLRDGGMSNALSQMGVSGMIFMLIWFMLLGLGVFGMWGSHVGRLFFYPEKIRESGMPNPDLSVKALRWYLRLYKDEEGKIYDDDEQLRKEFESLERSFDFTLQGTEGSELRQRFWIGRDERVLVKGTEKADGIPYFVLAWRTVTLIWKYTIGAAIKAVMCYFNPVKCGLEAAGAKVTQDLQAAHEGLNDLMAPRSGPLGAAESALRGGLGLPKIPNFAAAAATANLLKGGARAEADGLSTEAKIIAASLAALIGGGALKGLVDFLVPQ